MIPHGALTFQLMFSLIDTAQMLLTEPSSLPGAFRYADGVDPTTGEDVSMDVVFRYSPDTPDGEAGDDIADNLFKLGSHRIDADAVQENDVVVVTFSEPGPLAPMPCRGDSPQIPLKLTKADLGVLADSLSLVKLNAQ